MTSTRAQQSTALPQEVSRGVRDTWWYVGAVVLGGVLCVLAALNQPFNQNELKQIGPYGSNDLSTITSGTRQPPLDPLLGSLVQHLLGEGQLRQRLVPVLAGIGTLVVMALLLRKLGLGLSGAFALWTMATAPLLVRYSAYTRPYALPLFLSVLFVYAGQRWLDDRRKWWLAVACLAATGLPLSRVPEPTIFLATTAATVTAMAWRGRLVWSLAWPLAAIPLAALATVGYPMYRSLAGQSENIWDPSISGVIDRFPTGVEEIYNGLLPLLAEWMPWWPFTLLVVIAAFVVPAARRRLLQWWFVWPLLAAPVVFVLAYHFMNPFPFDIRPYRPRMAMFFVPGIGLMVAALAATVAEATAWPGRVRVGVGAFLAAVLVGQLPGTASVLLENEAADFEQAAYVLTHDLPPDAIVLYDTASRIGRWHQPFTAKARYMDDKPFVAQMSTLPSKANRVPKDGPVYLLFLDSECAFSVVCDEPPAPWDGQVDGWRIAKRFDKFTLYESDRPLIGRAGAITALRDFADSLGPDYGALETFAAAALLKLQGRPAEGQRLIHQLYAEASPELEARIKRNAEADGLDPFA
ncbi:MAG: glycosyltransferase family 39 protein [Nocardioidaceae bacterium]|nr:glycosyltransferase family 39 protein [Nocardioidaceae bacterium]